VGFEGASVRGVTAGAGDGFDVGAAGVGWAAFAVAAAPADELACPFAAGESHVDDSLTSLSEASACGKPAAACPVGCAGPLGCGGPEVPAAFV